MYGDRPKIEDPRALLYVCTADLFCGCGNPDDALRLVHGLLRAAPFYENQSRVDELLPTSGIQMLVLGALDKAELIEHGSSIGGSWLTDRGRATLDALELVAAEEGYKEFVDSDRCVHGYTPRDLDHDCMKADDPTHSDAEEE